MGINLSFAQFWQAIRVWPHSEIFTGRRPVKMLVGEFPKPAELLDTLELLTKDPPGNKTMVK